MNLTILTSGLITNKFGLRPALMCATRKDLSKHSVVRVVSEAASGWIGIAYGNVITGAKCQKGLETLSGFEALAEFISLEKGVFDLIQLDSRLLGDELAQSIGISIVDLIHQLEAKTDTAPLELLQNCKKVQDAVAILMSTEASSAPKVLSPTGEAEDDQDDQESDDEDWNLGDEGVIESLQRHVMPKPDPLKEQIDELSVSDSSQAEPVHVAQAQAEADRVLQAQAETDRVVQAQAEPVHVAQVQADTAPAKSPIEITDFSSNDDAFAQEPVAQFDHEKSDGSGTFPKEVPGYAESHHDRLGADTRAELHQFVKAKFGEEEGKRFFEEVDIETSNSYQSSIVLRDLESAIEKSKVDLAASGAFSRLGESLELIKKAEGKPENSKPRLKNASWVKPATGESNKPSPARVKPATGESNKPNPAWVKPSTTESNKPNPASMYNVEEDQESSRKVFTDQMRKSVEIDKKAFLSSSTEINGKLTLKFLKEKKFRQVIIITACTCTLFSGLAMLIFSGQRQSSLELASEKLTAGDLKGARACYEEIIRIDPGNYQAYLGHALAVPGDYKRQLIDYTKVLELRPHDFSTTLAVANTYYELKDYRNASLAADRAILLDKSQHSPMELKANSLIKLGEFQEASKVLELALSFNPGNKGQLYYLLSGCFKEMKNPERQEFYLNKALESEPKNPAYRKDMALLKFFQHDLSRAKDELEKAIAVNTSDGELHFRLAELFTKQKETDKAIGELTRAIDHGYGEADSLGKRGILYYSKHMYGDAKADLEEALSKNSNNEDVKSTLVLTDKAIAAAKAKVGTRQIADTSNTKETTVQDELSGDYVGKAYEQLKLGNIRYARRILKAAVRTNPNDARARRYLASALYSDGDYPDAALQFGYAAALQPLSPEEKLSYGKSLFRSSKLEPAIEVLESLVNEQPGYTPARLSLIKAYATAGFKDHAIEQCRIGMQQARNQMEYAQFKALMP